MTPSGPRVYRQSRQYFPKLDLRPNQKHRRVGEWNSCRRREPCDPPRFGILLLTMKSVKDACQTAAGAPPAELRFRVCFSWRSGGGAEFDDQAAFRQSRNFLTEFLFWGYYLDAKPFGSYGGHRRGALALVIREGDLQIDSRIWAARPHRRGWRTPRPAEAATLCLARACHRDLPLIRALIRLPPADTPAIPGARCPIQLTST